MRNVSAAVRQSTISALPNTVRVHMPTGNAAGCRSSAQNALITQAARGPDTVSAVSRCDTSTLSASNGTASSDASSRNSSGPSHSRALPPNVVARQVSGTASPDHGKNRRITANDQPRRRRQCRELHCRTVRRSGSGCGERMRPISHADAGPPGRNDGIRHTNRDGAVRHRHVERLADPRAATGRAAPARSDAAAFRSNTPT